MNFRFVGHLVSVIVLAIGVGIAVSAGVSALYGDPDVWALLLSAGIALVSGGVLFATTRLEGRTNIGYREGFLSVGIGWIVAMFFGALPYVVYGLFGWVDALFESMSGFTTTGASVLVDYNQPHGIFFWRALTHWYGGMGIIVLFIAVLRPLGAGAMRLFSAESPGPVTERLTPRIRDTARNLWLIYAGITLLEVVLLSAFGMDVFDAFCHSFATLATGGFSTQEASVGAYHSLPLELIIVVFMFVAGGNFALYYAVVRGQPRRLFRNPEFIAYASIMAAAVVVIAISLLVAKSHFSAGARLSRVALSGGVRADHHRLRDRRFQSLEPVCQDASRAVDVRRRLRRVHRGGTQGGPHHRSRQEHPARTHPPDASAGGAAPEVRRAHRPGVRPHERAGVLCPLHHRCSWWGRCSWRPPMSI